MNQPPENTNKRWAMPLLLLLFAAPVLVAFVLAQLGWRPAGTRNHGTLLEPPQDFNAVRAIEEADAVVDWNTSAGNWHVRSSCVGAHPVGDAFRTKSIAHRVGSYKLPLRR